MTNRIWTVLWVGAFAGAIAWIVSSVAIPLSNNCAMPMAYAQGTSYVRQNNPVCRQSLQLATFTLVDAATDGAVSNQATSPASYMYPGRLIFTDDQFVAVYRDGGTPHYERIPYANPTDPSAVPEWLYDIVSDSIYVARGFSTWVGVGIVSPDAQIHVFDSTDNGIKIETTDGATNYTGFALSAGLEPEFGQGAGIQLAAPSVPVVGNDLQVFNRTTGNIEFWHGIFGAYIVSLSLSAAGAATFVGPVSAPSFSGSIPFSDITSATNTVAAMIVGTGASLGTAGAGTIDSTTLLTNTWAAPAAIGGGTPAAGAFTDLSANTSLALTRNYVGATQAIVTNTTAGGTSLVQFVSVEDGGVTNMGTYSSTTTPYGAISANMGYIYGTTPNGIAIMADNVTGRISFATGGNTEKWNMSATGHLTATSDNTLDIGASGATRPRNLFLAGAATLGTALTVPNGGTGATSLTAWGVLYGNTAAAIGATAAGAANTLLHGNGAGAPTFSAVDLAADVTGTLPVPNGGTGIATVGTDYLLTGNGAGALTAESTLKYNTTDLLTIAIGGTDVQVALHTHAAGYFAANATPQTMGATAEDHGVINMSAGALDGDWAFDAGQEGTVTGTADNGAGASRCTTAGVNTLVTNDWVVMHDVTGDLVAGPIQVTVIDNTHFDVATGYVGSSTSIWEEPSHLLAGASDVDDYDVVYDMSAAKGAGATTLFETSIYLNDTRQAPTIRDRQVPTLDEGHWGGLGVLAGVVSGDWVWIAVRNDTGNDITIKYGGLIVSRH